MADTQGGPAVPVQAGPFPPLRLDAAEVAVWLITAAWDHPAELEDLVAKLGGGYAAERLASLLSADRHGAGEVAA